MDHEHKARTLTEILKELAESSAFHGIPKIASSRQLPVKILWSIVVLAGVGVMAFHLTELFQTFYSNPIQTTVSLDFSTLQFPAISICNMNPVRKSKIGLSPEFRDAVFPKKRRRPRSIASAAKRQKRVLRDLSDQGGPSFEKPYIPSGQTIVYSGKGLPEDKTVVDMIPAAYRERGVEEWIKLLGIKPSLINETFFEIRLEYINSVPTYRWSYKYPYHSDDSEPEVGQLPEDADYNFTEENTLEIVTELDQLNETVISTTESPYLFDYTDTDWDIFDSVDIDIDVVENYTSETLEILEKPIARFLRDPKDKWDNVITKFKIAFRDVSPEIRRRMGHQVTDFIQYVSFAKRQQNIPEFFEPFTTSSYGNCYTMDDSKFQSWRSGPEAGIKMTLHLEVDEYVERLSSGYGVRIVFHEPGTFPMPVEEGLTISPGFETSIGLRAINVTRLGEPYGQCTNFGSEKFRQKYNLTYSKTACLEFCRIENVINKCSCIPNEAPDIDFGEDVDVCNSKDELCTFEVELMLENGTLQCDCINHCSEFVYGKTISGRLWPHKDYLEKIIMKDMCAKNLTSLAKACKQVDAKNQQFDYDRYRNNFVRVIIYFEDLNYQKITEEPFYTTVRFICDIGGAMGLFIGVSILSLFEVLQLILELVLYLKDRKLNDGLSPVEQNSKA
ncbi:FMRFamide-activated amiloride-sensitive sodium channel-like [Mercenaria mercenaria]|uniref:FMRFamide-activated amiloride-sensitive sodium channel-like n=1 Tax=Mercenaria mercenaria TaxID=6596 RepID=UPI00234FB395|nr:FMRFamide-activated amiloride-sensitive sodium channel-like [Mercenaria mercenaria]